jgi:hypothetical protein
MVAARLEKREMARAQQILPFAELNAFGMNEGRLL